MKNLWFRFSIIAIVLLFAGWHLYPSIRWYSFSATERERREGLKDATIDRALNLGLDLRGGLHLVLELDMESLPLGTSLSASMNEAIEIIRNRIDQFGVSEPIIAKQGDRWLVVQIPGISDTDRAIDLIGKTALLEFKIVNENINVSDYIVNGEIEKQSLPRDISILKGKNGSYYAVRDDLVVDGRSLKEAEMKVGGESGGSPYVAISFDSEGAQQFAQITGRNINKRLAIILDGIVQSAPRINSRIPDGNAIIEGSFTPEDAKNLAIVLRAGALPAPVSVIENRVIGPTLGSSSVKRGAFSGLVGLILIVIFMLVYYKFSGLIIDLALILNAVIVLGFMAYFNATLTLPGIAGLLLTIGMAVDANVLINERIKEELATGNSIRLSIDSGYAKALSTILDSNITTLIVAFLLFQFGTGPVKGFAVTLTIGILASMFTSIFCTRFVYDLILRNQNIKTLSI